MTGTNSPLIQINVRQVATDLNCVKRGANHARECPNNFGGDCRDYILRLFNYKLRGATENLHERLRAKRF